jgi:hypothetical protein
MTPNESTLMNKTIVMTLAIAGTALTTPAAYAQCCAGGAGDMPPDCPMNRTASQAETSGPAALRAELSDFRLEDYATIGDALYKDDLEAAGKAAAVLAGYDKEGPMGKPARAIADSKDLAEARTHFKELTAVAVPIAKEQKAMYLAHCPMALNQQGADWLQASKDEIRNPYMGAKMAHCGAFRQ